VKTKHVRSVPYIEVDDDMREAVILFVQANSSLARELVEQLHADRFQAVLASGAEHARTLARMHRVRVVVIGELDAPRGALDLLEEIRGAGEAGGTRGHWDARLPVIAIGSGAGQLELLRAFDAGADDFIAAPVSYLELRGLISSTGAASISSKGAKNRPSGAAFGEGRRCAGARKQAGKVRKSWEKAHTGVRPGSKRWEAPGPIPTDSYERLLMEARLPLGSLSERRRWSAIACA
jgi:CheY-like chemotaxis protein